MNNGESSYRRFLNGDEQGFLEVINLYKDNLIYFLNRYIRDLDAAEDIAAETFADIFIHKKRYNFKTGLKTYIFSIGKNKAVNHYKKSLRKKDYEIKTANSMQYNEDILLLEEKIIKEEQNKRLNQAIGKLNDDYKAAIHLLYFENMSYNEAAEVLGKNKKQIDNLISRAKASLKTILEREGFKYEI